MGHILIIIFIQKAVRVISQNIKIVKHTTSMVQKEANPEGEITSLWGRDRWKWH